MWERGLKPSVGNAYYIILGRSPCGSVDWNICCWVVARLPPRSLPMWERGLKQEVSDRGLYRIWVAPHVGAWIETCARHISYQSTPSLPMWERGLKLVLGLIQLSPCCRSPCGSVDWNKMHRCSIWALLRRSPCGSVDWNLYSSIWMTALEVAPHVGAWIET